jgi:hypothetical protein
MNWHYRPKPQKNSPHGFKMAQFRLKSGDRGYEERVGLVVVAGEEFALVDFEGEVLGKDFQDSYVFGFEDRTSKVVNADRIIN